MTAITSAALETPGHDVVVGPCASGLGPSITNNSGYIEPCLRGVGLGYEGGVATYIDGVHQDLGGVRITAYSPVPALAGVTVKFCWISLRANRAGQDCGRAA